MIILALEFSSPQRSVAIARGENVLAEAVETGGGRGTPAFGMIETVLSDTKIEREEIETIAVGLGPGSYTGIRSAISIAQGWQLARGTKLIGVGSVEAIAAQAQAENFFGRVSVAIDAQRREIYLASFEISETVVREIEPLRIVSPSQFRPQAGELIIGPEATKWFPNSKIIFPRAAMIAKLAASRNSFVAGEKMKPIYLREITFVKAIRSNTLPNSAKF